MENTNETENTRHSIQVAIYLTIWDYGETALRTYLWLQVNWSEHLFICMYYPREGQTRIAALKPRLCMGCFFLLVLYFCTYLFQLIFLLSTYHFYNIIFHTLSELHRPLLYHVSDLFSSVSYFASM